MNMKENYTTDSLEELIHLLEKNMSMEVQGNKRRPNLLSTYAQTSRCPSSENARKSG